MWWCDDMMIWLWSIWWSIWWSIRIHDDDMVMPGYPINHRLLPVIALSLRILQIEGLESIPLSNMILDVNVRKADILSHCSSQITASNGSKRVSSISATTNALTKPLKILFTVRFTFSCEKKKWWSADAVGQRGDRTEVRRTDTSDCASMTIHEGWTNLQGLALPISDKSFRRCSRQDISPIWLQIRAQIPIYCSSSTRMRIVSWTDPVGASSFSRHWLPLWSANFSSQISHPKGEESCWIPGRSTQSSYENLTLMRRTSKPAGSSRI